MEVLQFENLTNSTGVLGSFRSKSKRINAEEFLIDDFSNENFKWLTVLSRLIVGYAPCYRNESKFCRRT